jgi:HSP20 family protein
VEWHRPKESIRREIDRMFDDFMDGFGRFPSREALPFASSPPIDVIEKDDAFQIIAELPGIDERDIEVKCTDGTLTIFGCFKRAVSHP